MQNPYMAASVNYYGPHCMHITHSTINQTILFQVQNHHVQKTQQANKTISKTTTL